MCDPGRITLLEQSLAYSAYIITWGSEITVFQLLKLAPCSSHHRLQYPRREVSICVLRPLQLSTLLHVLKRIALQSSFFIHCLTDSRRASRVPQCKCPSTKFCHEDPPKQSPAVHLICDTLTYKITKESHTCFHLSIPSLVPLVEAESSLFRIQRREGDALVLLIFCPLAVHHNSMPCEKPHQCMCPLFRCPHRSS